MDSQVFETTLHLLTVTSDDNLLKEGFEEMVRWEKDHPPKSKYDGFEWFEVHVDPRTLNALVVKRVLDVRMKTNKSINYRLHDLEAVKKALETHATLTAPMMVTESTIPHDFMDIIVGHEDKKELIMRALQAPVPVHFLLHGSVASAKSLMLEELSRLPGSVFVLGSSLTKAGLYDIFFSEKQALRYLIIDELEKVSDTDNLTALLSLMERGHVVEAKFKRHRSLKLRTWVFGSANRINKLSEELLSRFGPLKFKDYTREEFFNVVESVLTKREGIKINLANYIAECCADDLQSMDVRDAIRIARLLKEKTKDDVDFIMAILIKQKA